MRWVKRILAGIGVLVLVLLVAVVAALMWFHIPSNAAGVVAQTVCSAKYVSGRNLPTDQLVTSDVAPQSPILAVVSTSVDDTNHTVTSKFLGIVSRTSALQTQRGCVLDAPADPTAVPYEPNPTDPAAWPTGDATTTVPGVDTAALTKVVDAAFVGSDDPMGLAARGVAVVQHGKLVLLKDGAGIKPNTALLGWSMTKTVTGMLAWKVLQDKGIGVDTKVVDAFPAGRAPSWVEQWKADDRKSITIADLMFMRSGLKIDEGYGPTGDVVQMLYGESDMSGWAAQHPLDHQPATYWEYLSASTNILAAVVRAQFPDDQAYVDYASTSLFEPLGLSTATLATDASGTWVGSSYLWASTADWARLGQLMLKDGSWEGTQVIPSGWWRLAGTPAMPSGEGHGYGAQTWIPGEPNGGECSATPGYPADTLLMEGHYGQVVAMVPSKDAVIVRLGWSVDTDFDGCAFVADVAKTLPNA
ncbi:MAG TPA: serine hydrolase [Candidatus Nanopelagicales bacterium]|nr:serine hydrolase [Candidatus Nanopelagicales bacterium]